MAESGDKSPNINVERKNTGSVKSFIDAVNLSNMSDKDTSKHLRDCKKRLKEMSKYL